MNKQLLNFNFSFYQHLSEVKVGQNAWLRHNVLEKWKQPLGFVVNLPSCLYAWKRRVERRLARSNIQGAEIYTGEWVVSWRICWGFHLTFKQPQGGKKSVENWKIFDQLFWKWPFDSCVGGHFDPQISNFVVLCTWQQESTMVNPWYAWYANICKGGAMNGGSLRLLGPKELTWLRRTVHMAWNSENNYKARLVSAERDEHKS